jgi:hypothetical protein
MRPHRMRVKAWWQIGCRDSVRSSCKTAHSEGSTLAPFARHRNNLLSTEFWTQGIAPSRRLPSQRNKENDVRHLTIKGLTSAVTSLSLRLSSMRAQRRRLRYSRCSPSSCHGSSIFSHSCHPQSSSASASQKTMGWTSGRGTLPSSWPPRGANSCPYLFDCSFRLPVQRRGMSTRETSGRVVKSHFWCQCFIFGWLVGSWFSPGLPPSRLVRRCYPNHV